MALDTFFSSGAKKGEAERTKAEASVEEAAEGRIEIPSGLRDWVNSLGEGLDSEETSLLKKLEEAGAYVTQDFSGLDKGGTHKVKIKIGVAFLPFFREHGEKDAVETLEEIGISEGISEKQDAPNVAEGSLPFPKDRYYNHIIKERLLSEVQKVFRDLGGGKGVYDGFSDRLAEGGWSEEKIAEKARAFSAGESPEALQNGAYSLIGMREDALEEQQETLYKKIFQDAATNPFQSEHLDPEEQKVIEDFKRTVEGQVLQAYPNKRPGIVESPRKDINVFENGISPKMAAEYVKTTQSLRRVKELREAIRFFQDRRKYKERKKERTE